MYETKWICSRVESILLKLCWWKKQIQLFVCFYSTEFQKYWFNSWANPLHLVHCPKHTVPRFESFVGILIIQALLLLLNKIEINFFFQAHHHSHNFLQKNQIWEQFVSDNVRNEVDLLKSRTNIAETLLTEKTKQLDLVQKQVDMLKQHLLSADQLNKEQAIMIESLKRRLNGGRRENGNGTSNNGKLNVYKKIWG